MNRLFIWAMVAGAIPATARMRSERLEQTQKKGRKSASEEITLAYSTALLNTTAEKQSRWLAEMLHPTRRTCQARPGSSVSGGGPTNGTTHYRWVFLVQTGGGARRKLVLTQLMTFLALYPHVIVGEHTSDPERILDMPGGVRHLRPPLTQAWGGPFGQKILGGISCVHSMFGSRYDFLGVLDDDTIVNVQKLDLVLQQLNLRPSDPYLLGPDMRVQCRDRGHRVANGSWTCNDDKSKFVAPLARTGKLFLSSEAAVVEAIGQGHLHGGAGTVLSQGAVEIMAATRPMRPPVSQARTPWSPHEQFKSSDDDNDLVECESRFVPRAPEKAKYANTNVATDADIRARGRCRVAENTTIRALHENYEHRHGIQSHLGVCSRCLVCPWWGYRQQGLSPGKVLLERHFGFGNCTGAGEMLPPCKAGDVALAACLAALGVSPTVEADLSVAFLHLNKYRNSEEYYKSRAIGFLQEN